ncbi:IAA-alanine resistance protein 1 [Camellia lanceoleosa]|uniref:IAA-alanine resistance protein 1 n=1 Tax=Camellia lanceoleosa TaxID=1840588 RepID=A0ACC0G1V0_9ERIC|nr:IAA-alanine resistance protein 1 [Camellia lanceoleosa]
MLFFTNCPMLLRKTGSSAGKDNISDADAPNGSTHHIKSMVEKELSHSPSNLVFGYLNLFADSVHNFTDGMALGSASSFMDQLVGGQELCFCLHMSFLKSLSKALFFNFLSALVALARATLALVMSQDQGQSSLIEDSRQAGSCTLQLSKCWQK